MSMRLVLLLKYYPWACLHTNHSREQQQTDAQNRVGIKHKRSFCYTRHSMKVGVEVEVGCRCKTANLYQNSYEKTESSCCNDPVKVWTSTWLKWCGELCIHESLLTSSNVVKESGPEFPRFHSSPCSRIKFFLFNMLCVINVIDN